MATDLDGATPAFAAGVLAELTGDDPSARSEFERVLSAPSLVGSAPLAARAALHLAQLESHAGHSRRALDLVARAAALAPGDEIVGDGVARVRADAVAASGEGDIRGPRLGTPLPGIPPKLADAFAAAERAFEAVHKLHPRAYIEALSTSLRTKEDATESAVARYRAIAEYGGLAEVAATYRIGSLYHDLALALLFFELPSELDPRVSAGLRRTLRGRALTYLKRAVTEYQTSLAEPPLADAELWRLAAETDLRGAFDVLGEAGQARHP